MTGCAWSTGLESAKIEVNRERKHLRCRVPGQEKYTRCDTLKGGYTEQAIKERIHGGRTVKPRRTSSQKPASRVGLLVDIEAAIRSGKRYINLVDTIFWMRSMPNE